MAIETLCKITCDRCGRKRLTDSRGDLYDCEEFDGRDTFHVSSGGVKVAIELPKHLVVCGPCRDLISTYIVDNLVDFIVS